MKLIRRVSISILFFSMQICIFSETYQPGAWIRNWSCLGSIPAEMKNIDRNYLSDFGNEPDALFLKNALSDITNTSPSLKIKSVHANTQGELDLVEIIGDEENVLAYCWTIIESPRSGTAILKAGSDDWIKIWLNGKEVHKNPVQRSAAPDQDLIPVHLREGVNTLAVKIGQGWGGWKLQVRFSHLMQQEKGAHLDVISPSVAPLILTGSVYPVDQFYRMTLFNYGTETARDFKIKIESDQLQETFSQPFNCDTGEFTDVIIPLEIKPETGTNKSISFNLLMESPDGLSVKIHTVHTSSIKAHPFLTRKTEVFEPFSIVQISDPHIEKSDSILQGVNTADRLKQAVSEINEMSPLPDFVIVTGDMVMDRMQAYDLYLEIIDSLDVPVIHVFGNHDKPLGLAEADRLFSQWGLPPYYTFIYKGRRFVILDTVASAAPNYGMISEEQIQWLENSVNLKKDTITACFLHHEIFSDISTTNPEDVLSIVENHPGKFCFFAGHWHLDCFVKNKNQIHIVTTSTGYVSEQRGMFKHNHGAPGYRIIKFEKNGIKTRFKPIGKPSWSDPLLDDYYTVGEIRNKFN